MSLIVSIYRCYSNTVRTQESTHYGAGPWKVVFSLFVYTRPVFRVKINLPMTSDTELLTDTRKCSGSVTSDLEISKRIFATNAHRLAISPLIITLTIT